MLPKIIWRYWETGWDTIKWPLEEITQSVAHYAADWEVRDLDKDSVTKYIDLPAKLWELPVQVRSDAIRIMLLSKYGGVWLDATVFLNTNFTEYMKDKMEADFFLYWRYENYTCPSNWFLSAQKDSYIATEFTKIFLDEILSDSFREENEKYFANWRWSKNYFLFNKLFVNEMKQNEKFNEIVRHSPLEFAVHQILPANNDWLRAMPRECFNEIDKTPMYKLSHSRNQDNAEQNCVLNIAIKKMKGELTPEYIETLSNTLPHTALGTTSLYLWDQSLNNPNRCKTYCGVFNSEGDMGIKETKASRYHVFNFSSRDYKNNCQILIPYGQNRIFFRKQNGNTFDKPQEFILKSEFDALTKRLEVLEKKLGVKSGNAELAPPITFAQAYRAIKGVRVPTSNFELSLKKSNFLIRLMYKLYKKFK